MKKRIAKIFAILMVAGTLLPANHVQAAVGDTLNLALSATVTTSLCSSWETLGAVNDGISSTSSLTKPSAGAYGNWNGESDYGTYNWVQYEWDNAHILLSTSVYWWIDNTATPAVGISTPTDAYIQYWNGAAWITFGNIGLSLNKFNTLDMGVLTKKIRINMASGASTGIIEWQAYGVECGACEPTSITPYVQLNGGDTLSTNLANVETGDSAMFGISALEGGIWNWSGPGDLSDSTETVTLTNLQPSQSGTYTGTYVNACGSSSSCYFHLTVRDTALAAADAYTWPSYSPTLSYNFKDEYPTLTEPTQILDDCPEVVGTISSGWWTFRWGPDANSLIDSAAVIPMLTRMNEDFAYFRDTLGWPPDKRAKEGYKSAIYLYGSGLSTDDASNTDLGGWQSAIYYNSESWPMVLLSYYPVYSFNPACTYSDKVSQQGAVVHEGIHSVLADLPGCKDAAWFQEGGNTWLQQEASVRQTNSYSGMGYLNIGSFLAPFMPIECYSGWLQDGSFGGPSAEGVNMTDTSGAQVCTWRNLLGGVQYSNIFPTFLGMTLGSGSVPWIWRNCESRVLEGMAEGLGELQLRRLISEYRAKQAVLDMGKWTTNMKSLLNSNMGVTIKAEWSPYWINVASWSATPYVVTSKDANNVLTPEARTLPGWSGANQIPLSVSGDEVTVNFQPVGRNMTCQLCYRTKSGLIRYSQVVNGGDCTLKLDVAPANNVVFAVITNTDYIYEGDTTRKTHYDYRLQLVKGVTGTAAVNKKWYDWTLTLVDLETPSMSETTMELFPNPLGRNQSLNISFSSPIDNSVALAIRNVSGQLVYSKAVTGNSLVQPDLKSGIYIVTANVSGIRVNRKLIVQ